MVAWVDRAGTPKRPLLVSDAVETDLSCAGSIPLAGLSDEHHAAVALGKFSGTRDSGGGHDGGVAKVRYHELR